MQPPSTDTAELLTYDQAARALGITRGSIQVQISRGALHPVKLPKQKIKYLRREEVEWYARRRQGTRDEPNPVLPGAPRNVIAEQWAQEAADLLTGSLLWGLSDEGDAGAQMRRKAMHQVAILRATDTGRAVLAAFAARLAAVLATFPTAESVSTERQRLQALLDAITAPGDPATAPAGDESPESASTAPAARSMRAMSKRQRAAAVRMQREREREHTTCSN